ncbi:MAG TPA: hypothetical protein VFL97_07675 [Nitrococcus sp.]|nr:hypothetical protein [Nitrococcus sp.]
MIYFGALHCAWSNQPHADRLLESIKLRLSDVALNRGWTFEAVGVALDWNPDDGIAHLRSLGKFDEIATGYNWANGFAIQYFGDRLPGPKATPQILVVRRTLVVPDFVHTFNFKTAHESIVARANGVVAIRRWMRAGMPLLSSGMR